MSRKSQMDVTNRPDRTDNTNPTDSIIPAPVTRTWTPEQRDAIDDSGHDLLVSAAAGSGKTAVLTERVLRLITQADASGAPPAALEELLVITFTRKAAREMRDRIERRILAALEQSPESGPLRAAIDALPRANIMTLDAFCDRLVRKHFHKAGVSPGARIADDDEDREISRRAADAAFTERCEGPDEAADAFALLLAGTAQGRTGSPLTALAARVNQLRTFLASLEDPEAWLARARAELEATVAASAPGELPGMERVASVFRASLEELVLAFDGMMDAAGRRFGAAALAPGLRQARVNLESLLTLAGGATGDTFLTVKDQIGAVLDAFPDESSPFKLGLKKVCGGDIFGDKPFCEKMLGIFSRRLDSWAGVWFSLDAAHEWMAARLAAGQLLQLIGLAQDVDRRAAETKRRRGLLSFSDIERAAIVLLSDETGIGPSEVAGECQRLFRHVLVDEYQDISPLQDAIIRRLSHTDDIAPGAERNLFIVGDLKQGIYRFRRADPSLFSRRMEEWGSERGAETARRRVNLRTNFRSRPGVLACVNALFESLMDRALGGVDYDDDARLHAHRADSGGDDAGGDIVVDPVCAEVHWIIDDEHKTPSAGGDESGGADQGGEATGDDEAASGFEREAEWIAGRILDMTAEGTGTRVHDERTGAWRIARPGDCAILVRRVRADLDAWIAALARHGLAVAAAGRDAMLSTPEAADLLGALRLADHPFQDIPLAAVMRSPLARFTDDDLLRIRMAARGGPFHRAVWIAAGRGGIFEQPVAATADSASPARVRAESVPISQELRARLEAFLDELARWRRLAGAQGPEASLDRILAVSHYEARVMGLPDGRARAEGIAALRLAMRAHAGRTAGEAPLPAFLRWIDEGGGGAGGDDPGEAGGGGAGAVRLMTIHKSKGLEFPIVFLPRLFSPFAGMRGGEDWEMHSELGMAAAGVEPERRLLLRPAALTALREVERREGRAEDLRLLYVALTRARDRLVLVGTPRVKSYESLTAGWSAGPMACAEGGPTGGAGVIAPLWRLTAYSPGDLIGPVLHALAHRPAPPEWLSVQSHEGRAPRPSGMTLEQTRQALCEPERWTDEDWAGARAEFEEESGRRVEGCGSGGPDGSDGSIRSVRFESLLLPPAHHGLCRVPSKVIASGLRRDPQGQAFVWRPRDIDPDEGEWFEEGAAEIGIPARGPLHRGTGLGGRLPQFILAGAAAGSGGAAGGGGAVGRAPEGRGGNDPARLSAREKGTLTHQFLRHLDLRGPLTREGIREQARLLYEAGRLDVGDPALLAQLPFGGIAEFFKSGLGQFMGERPGAVQRELPIRWWMQASALHERTPGGLAPLVPEEDSRPVLVQGTIDCVIDEGDRAVIIDYKTDHIAGAADIERLTAEYYAQVDTYRKALRSVWRIPVEAHLVFLGAGVNVLVEDPLG